MNDLTMKNDRRHTLQEIADITGTAYSTVAAYAQKAGWTENGKKTLLTDAQAAIIIEAMKRAHAGGGDTDPTFRTSLEAVTTELTPVVQLKMIQAKKEDLHRQELAIYEAENQRLLAEKQALQIELSQDKEWYSVKRVLIETGKNYPWRPLKEYSAANGYEVKQVFDQNYANVNAYHVNVWHAVYGLEL
ncbi:hypothetical protein AGMMS49944_30420 [Spirochaetia bacterium]|nr:hypothetical protein AGMMS49944_30420 [Spirochaetia bacterium]